LGRPHRRKLCPSPAERLKGLEFVETGREFKGLTELRRAADEIRKTVGGKDKAAFGNRVLLGRAYWGGYR